VIAYFTAKARSLDQTPRHHCTPISYLHIKLLCIVSEFGEIKDLAKLTCQT